METLEGARAPALARLGLHAPEGAEDIEPGVRPTSTRWSG